MKAIIEQIRNLHNLPYAERLNPAIEVYNSLQQLGYKSNESKKIMRTNGVSHALIFRIPAKHLSC